MREIFSYQPVLVLLDIILQQLVSDDHVFADKFTEVFYIITGKLAIMSDHFQGKVDCCHTSLALAKLTLVVHIQVTVKLAKHCFYLVVDILELWGDSKFVKKNGIAFHFRYFKPQLVGVDQ